MKPIKLVTNTAYLLNHWFPDSDSMWQEPKELIKELHNKTHGCFVEVTFKKQSDKKINKFTMKKFIRPAPSEFGRLRKNLRKLRALL